MNLQVTDYSQLIAFWLIFTRMMVIMIQLPLFDNMTIPNMVKVLCGILITYAFYPYLGPEMLKDVNYLGVENFWALTIFNVTVGFFIGFIVKSIMGIFTASGAIITQQIGFAAVRYFDPSASQQVGPFEKLIQWTIIIMILMSGALFPMFKGAFQSFFSIHIYDLGKFATTPQYYLELFKGIFFASVLLAGPVIFINILIMAVLGIIARMVPQMNIIMTSFAVTIGMGLLVFAVSSNEFFQVGYKLYTEKLGNWFQFVI